MSQVPKKALKDSRLISALIVNFILEHISNKCIRLDYTNWMLPIKKLVHTKEKPRTTNLAPRTKQMMRFS